MKTRQVLLLAIAVASLALYGCGRGRPGIVPVSGQVTIDHQPCPAKATVWFTAVEAAPGFTLHPAIGDCDEQGFYRAKTFAPGDGLLPGKYRIWVACWEVPPNMEGKPVKSYLPAKYASPTTSGLELAIEPGSPAQFFNVDIDGPAREPPVPKR
jgi:hypothetical protein